jgi:ComF family protein
VGFIVYNPRMLATLARDLGSFIYPPTCACCRSAIDRDAVFCPTCHGSLTTLATHPTCPRCASPIGEGSACPFCAGDGIYPLESIIAFGSFREPLRKIVHEMKYHHRWPLAETLADRMLKEPRIRNLLDEIDMLIPIPLHWTRQIVRGYNQADALALRLARHRRELKVVHPLVRLKNTTPQTTVRSLADRAENLRHAFGLTSSAAIKNKRVALVDDVKTTGSTLKAAARALQVADPVCVHAIVLAAADPHRRDFQAV